LNRDIETNVGKLGRFEFVKGLYAYVGSAQNSLEPRIRRHLRREKSKFWHIDYLLDSPETIIVKTYVSKAHKEQECKTARKLSEVGNPVEGFGSSDCDCRSHLVRIDSDETFRNSSQGFDLFTPDS
jgi:Uri superfamily endonuclease